jgi:hypothetical protein
MRVLEESVPYVATIADRLRDSPDRGINMGDWYSILTQIRESRSIRLRSAAMPFPEIFAAWMADPARAALGRLKSRRDDDSHGRRPETAELGLAHAQARADLTSLFEDADFVVDYPLRLIEETRWRAVDESTAYDYRDLRGDHPLVPLEHARAGTYRLETGSLYVATRRGELHRVTPVLARAACPRCNATATFCFDKLDRASRRPIYRALEHRHSAERPDLKDDLKAIGLLTAEA